MPPSQLDAMTVIAIFFMAGSTYLTRIIGYAFLHNRTFSPRIRYVMEAAPGCVLISVIAPYFASGNLADTAALAVTMMAAMRFPFLVAVIIGVTSAAVLRQIIS